MCFFICHTNTLIQSTVQYINTKYFQFKVIDSQISIISCFQPASSQKHLSVHLH